MGVATFASNNVIAPWESEPYRCSPLPRYLLCQCAERLIGGYGLNSVPVGASLVFRSTSKPSSYAFGGMSAKGAGHQWSCDLTGRKRKRIVTNSAGRAHWRCPDCGTSSLRRRPDVVWKTDLELSVKWLLEPLGQGKVADASTRSFRRDIALCWDVEPVIPGMHLVPAIPGQDEDQKPITSAYISWHYL